MGSLPCSSLSFRRIFKMALHQELYPSLPPLGLWLRLPIQGVLIAWAYWYTRPEAAARAEQHS
jgi:uncharacterized membrane protein